MVEKYKIRNKSEFTNISEFMMDNIGYLENAFLFYEAKRYDLKGKKYLANNSKYYLCDSSLRYAVNGTRNMDFVAKKREAQIYIQVSDNISDEKNLKENIRHCLQ